MSSFTKKMRSLLQVSSRRSNILLTGTVCLLTFLLFFPLLPYFLNGNVTDLAKNVDRVRVSVNSGAGCIVGKEKLEEFDQFNIKFLYTSIYS